MAIKSRNTTFAAAFAAACLGTTALTPAGVLAAPQAEQTVRDFDIGAQSLQAALLEFSRQANSPIVAPIELMTGRQAPAVQGRMNERQALNTLLSGSGLSATQGPDGGWAIGRRDADAPQSGSAAGDGAGTVEALIVTAQKREEQIQDVPIAISAFTEKTLQEQKIEGGYDLLKAIPNVTFSKNNFTGYNFSIRGIGTKAVSATTDPGVAVSFNNIALIQNRLFEQEYFDVERVEVLRGPQGTLYGRNATAGVINVISAKPDLRKFDGWIKGEVGNYHAKRLSAMVNIPIVDDKLGIRIAGALTNRSGYDYNTGTQHAVNGRDLWSGRITVGFNPTERLRTDLVWERFNEDDNRSRTGKQLCYHDPGLSMVGNTPTVSDPNFLFNAKLGPALFSQGCKPGSLYDPQAFGTPNGLAMPFIFNMLVYGADCNPPGMHNCTPVFALGYDQPRYINGAVNPNAHGETLIQLKDPYGGQMQSPDLRVINSFRDPIYQAKADVLEFNLDFDLTDDLTLSSQIAYDKDSTYSFQDYNRFNTVPIFNDTSQMYATGDFNEYLYSPTPRDTLFSQLAPGGVFCDPQLGCSKSIAGFDIASAKAEQFSQEIRLVSNFKGPINFSVGADYTKFRTLVDYYVMYNMITAFAMTRPFGLTSDYTKCPVGIDYSGPVPAVIQVPLDSSACANDTYIDPNPVDKINGEGHNYFRSKNPYRLASWAGFGEAYWQATDELKVTAGLRYTDDLKTFDLYPTQVLVSPSLYTLTTPNRGLQKTGEIDQHWGAVTGRLGVDWKPHLPFTDQTMIYAFYSRGYKGGGANPPGVFVPQDYTGFVPEKDYGDTFKPEYVNAYEVGSKNTLLGGGLTLNGDAFFYDYKDYQVTQIKDRTAVNDNFDARIWGLELETAFAPNRDLRFIANFGYLNTRIADGQWSVDVMNRTASNPDYVVIKPAPPWPSNCVVPVWVAEAFLQRGTVGGYQGLCLVGIDAGNGYIQDPHFNNAIYDPARYPELNGGTGIAEKLGGNALPNAPHWTMNIGAQKTWEFGSNWTGTIRADGYWQSQSWARVYNAVNDKLHGWYNANLSVWLERPDDGLKIELYAKNILDKTPITDAFINSDDTALTTNVFVLDPRLIGLSIRKEF